MAIFELFSMRQKKARGEYPDVYVYDELPITLKRQIVHLFDENIGRYYGSDSRTKSAYDSAYQILCKEYGVFYLDSMHNDPQTDILNFFLKTDDIEKSLDIIELLFRWIAKYNQYIKGNEVVDELNSRFKMNGVGFEFFDNRIIRIDSELTHQEIIKPTLAFLRNEKSFSGANEEFLKAHEFYRHQEYKQAVIECTKAFES